MTGFIGIHSFNWTSYRFHTILKGCYIGFNRIYHNSTTYLHRFLWASNIYIFSFTFKILHKVKADKALISTCCFFMLFNFGQRTCQEKLTHPCYEVMIPCLFSFQHENGNHKQGDTTLSMLKKLIHSHREEYWSRSKWISHTHIWGNDPLQLTNY